MRRFNTDLLGKKVLIGILLAAFIVGTGTMVLAEKSSRKGYLGVSIERLASDDRKELGVSHGVIVTHVEEDSPADGAGILEDDIILYFAGKKIRRTDDLVQAVRETKPKTEAKVTLMRDGERKEITVEVGRIRSSIVYRMGGKDGIVTVFGGGGGYLGVSLQELNEDLAGYFGTKENEGALILSVKEDSPAEDVGLKAGDVIVEIDKAEVGDPQDVRDILSDFEEGDEVEVVVIRHKRKKRFNVELDESSYHSNIQILKDFKVGDLKGLNFRLNRPHLEHIEIPKLDYNIRLHKDLGRSLRYKLDTIRDKLERKLHRVDERVKVIKETVCI